MLFMYCTGELNPTPQPQLFYQLHCASLRTSAGQGSQQGSRADRATLPNLLRRGLQLVAEQTNKN